MKSAVRSSAPIYRAHTGNECSTHTMTYTPIVTPCGVLQGRTAMYLDEIHWAERVLTLIVDVQVNTAERNAIPYDVVFRGVAGFRMTELDVWEESPESRLSKSSFDEVTDSPMLAAVAFRFEGCRHFSVVT